MFKRINYEWQPALGMEEKVGPVYEVTVNGKTWKIAKVRFPKVYAGDKPATQWLVWFEDGKLWYSFGKTRQAAYEGALQHYWRNR